MVIVVIVLLALLGGKFVSEIIFNWRRKLKFLNEKKKNCEVAESNDNTYQGMN